MADMIARIRRRRPRQHRRRLLRHDAGPHPRHCRGASTGNAPREVPEPSSRMLRLSGLEPFTLTPDIPLRQCRRAHERHRLGALPQADQGRRLPAALDVARDQVAERRADHRHQHGRGPDRLREGDGRVPQPRRRRARHRARADDGRFLEVRGHRGRPEVRPGQGDREFDLDEGGRGRSSSSRRGSCRITARPSSSWPSTRRARPTPARARSRSARAPTRS